MVSFVKKTCSKHTIYNFDVEVQKISTVRGVNILFIKCELWGIYFMVVIFETVAIVQSQEIVNISENLSKLTR